MEALEEGGRSVRDIEHGGDPKVPEMGGGFAAGIRACKMRNRGQCGGGTPYTSSQSQGVGRPLQNASGPRIGAEYTQEYAVVCSLGDSGDHGGVVAVLIGVDKERVLPIHTSAWSFIDVAEIDSCVSEHREHINKSAGGMLSREHY